MRPRPLLLQALLLAASAGSVASRKQKGKKEKPRAQHGAPAKLPALTGRALQLVTDHAVDDPDVLLARGLSELHALDFETATAMLFGAAATAEAGRGEYAGPSKLAARGRLVGAAAAGLIGCGEVVAAVPFLLWALERIPPKSAEWSAAAAAHAKARAWSGREATPAERFSSIQMAATARWPRHRLFAPVLPSQWGPGPLFAPPVRA